LVIVVLCHIFVIKRRPFHIKNISIGVGIISLEPEAKVRTYRFRKTFLVDPEVYHEFTVNRIRV
jgi:hypothetical protein